MSKRGARSEYRVVAKGNYRFGTPRDRVNSLLLKCEITFYDIRTLLLFSIRGAQAPRNIVRNEFLCRSIAGSFPGKRLPGRLHNRHCARTRPLFPLLHAESLRNIETIVYNVICDFHDAPGTWICKGASRFGTNDPSVGRFRKITDRSGQHVAE